MSEIGELRGIPLKIIGSIFIGALCVAVAFGVRADEVRTPKFGPLIFAAGPWEMTQATVPEKWMPATVRVVVGFSDTTCAPCAVYAAYNAIRVEDKGIRHGFGMSHSCFGSLYKEIGMWLTHD